MAFHEQHLTIDHAATAMRAGDLAGAETICLNLLKKNKRDVDALQLRGTLALKRYDFDAALKFYKKCLAIRPREPAFQYLVGKVDAMDGRFPEALKRFDRALAMKPDFEIAAEWKATVLEWNGDYDEARAVLEPFVSAAAENANMAEVQAKVDMHAGRYDQAVAILTRHLEGELDSDSRHRMGHLAGNAYERLGEYDRAFAAHTDANQAVAGVFDPLEYVGFIDRLIGTCSAELLARLPRPRARPGLPVFIAGMPRSGTTLVEQIIDAHPLAHGAGELRDIDQLVVDLQLEIDAVGPYPECVADLEPADVERLSGRFLARLRKIAPSARRVANKSLENYKHLGLIAILFPGASIIHCHREPRDTCLSCYMSNILPSTHPYVTDLGHIGLVYRQYERLMSHWKSVLDLSVLDVSYEAVVADLETHARRIIEFCGLDWDDRCLSFHKTRRVVMTLSYDQVRKPIYTSSLNRYKNYERHLGPLNEELRQKLR